LRIYTRTGDDGTTGLFGGGRVAKDDARVQAYGAVDELNAVLGVARAACEDGPLAALIGQLQHTCFVVGSDLATPAGGKATVRRIGADDVTELEGEIDAGEAQLPALVTFILPGGSLDACHMHHARTVCRRAERWVVGLEREGAVSAEVLQWLNRLSDLLFVLARVANVRAGVDDVAWLAD
jgi:cob(I)alamin adenosyltransferase